MKPYTNRDIAELLEVHPVTVSRIRSGNRKPSLELMRKISKELGWTLSRQVASMEDDTYATDFREFLQRRYGIPAE